MSMAGAVEIGRNALVTALRGWYPQYLTWVANQIHHTCLHGGFGPYHFDVVGEPAKPVDTGETVDIRCDALKSMIEQLHGLVADSELLGVYLASLGIGGDDLTLSI